MKRNWRKVSATFLALASSGVVAGGVLAESHLAVLAGLSLGLVLLVFVLLIVLERLNALYVHQREVVLHDLLPGMRADAEGQNARIEGLAYTVSEIHLELNRSQELHRQQYCGVGDALNSTAGLLQAVAADASAAHDREADARRRLIVEVGAIRVGVAAQLEAAVSGLELASKTATDFVQRVDGRLDLLGAEVCSSQDALADLFHMEASNLKSQISALAEDMQQAVERDLTAFCAEIEQSTLRSGERAEQLSGQLNQDFTLIASRLEEAASSADDRFARLSEQMDVKFDTVCSDVEKSTSTLMTLIEDVRKGTSESLADTGGRLESAIGRAQASNDVEKSRQTNELIQNMDALFQLRSSLPESSMGPLLGDWAMDPVGMRGVVDLIFSCRPDHVLECGSGASTIWIARAMEVLGKGKITSIEHLEEYAVKTREAIQRASLSSRAKVVLAHVEEKKIDGEVYNWYGTRGLRVKPGSIDLLLVDGPPGNIGPSARYPALPLLKHLLAERALILLDDCDRPNEIEIEQRWLAENPELSVSGRVGPRTILMIFQRAVDEVARAL